MKELFVCEKPSIARYLAQVISGGFTESNGYYTGKDGRVYGAAIGHLVQCKSPQEINEKWSWKGDPSNFPFFMTDIPLKVIDTPAHKQKFKLLVDLMKKADTIYVATDAGREGEHIFRKIYKLSGVNNKKLKRIWLKNLTENGVRKSFENVSDAKNYDGLALAGQLREESDLIIGTNATVLTTKLSSSKNVLSLGRVQTPTLAMIVNRDKQIENFSKVTHYTVETVDQLGNKFELVLDNDTHLNKEQAKKIIDQLGRRENFSVNSETKKEKPEKLFDLTELQKHMNKKHKWSAKKTLEITQKLYEKQYVTYPRTNSQYIASDEELSGVLASHSGNGVIKKIIEEGYSIEPSFVNPEKVTDHEAIIITEKQKGSLDVDEDLLYNVILTRFAAAFYPPAVKKETVALFEDGEYQFKSKETVLIEPGWRELYNSDIEEGTLEQSDLSQLGDYTLLEKETKPPGRYTEASLLNDMKHAAKFLNVSEDKKIMKQVEGIGTPATRDSIIETLLNRGFIERDKNKLVSTKLGRELINMMPEDFSLYSVQLTALFETLLADVERGELSKKEFYKELEQLVIKTSEEIRKNVKKVTIETEEKEVIAVCKKCGNPIYESSKVYGCSGYRKKGCKVGLFKNGLEKLGKKKVSKKEASQLLSGKVVKVQLKSKGKTFKADVVFNFDKNWIEFANKK
ncbi:DNA topoisomerase [Bacillus subtilis]|nr:DNA topoisomerase [Bacillus subtilis]AYK68267.1 DNA topoisomerase III [Bacillus subtilis subsp. subtilis]